MKNFTRHKGKVKKAIILMLFTSIGLSRGLVAQVNTNQFKGVNWADTETTSNRESFTCQVYLQLIHTPRHR